MVKIDPYKNKERYFKWCEKTKYGIPGISKFNSDIIKEYLNDMEMGLNVSSKNKKGARSYIRLNVLAQRISFMAKAFEKRLKIEKIINVSESELFDFFKDMRSGKITKKDGAEYKSIKDFAKDFRSFWHWHQKKNKKAGTEIQDITLDLDTSGEKPTWVYFTEEQVKTLAQQAKYRYRVLIWFLFDTGIRSPTELMNTRVCDFYNNFKELEIREEVSKTFGRKIKLMICSELIKEYVTTKGLEKEDYLFTISPAATNKYLKKLSKKIFGEGKSPAGAKYSDLTMYDFRHISCCYWLPRYKSESALKYRFGWKRSEKIHYYSELLGMKDTISEEDMLIDVTKVEIERRLDKAERENGLLREDNELMKIQIAQIAELTARLYRQMKVNQGLEL